MRRSMFSASWISTRSASCAAHIRSWSTPMTPTVSSHSSRVKDACAGPAHAYVGADELRELPHGIMITFSVTLHTPHQHLLELELGARSASGVETGHAEVSRD